MAEPQKKQAPSQSVVGQCAATDCEHNQDRECHAGEITVRMEGGAAVCGTYSPRSPKPRP